MKDQAVLMYVKDETLYPVALTEEQQYMLQMTVKLFSPLTIVQDHPQGKACNLLPLDTERSS
ncbi:hypothetical protein [Halobacillus sp. BBL2006]|uniref:hypothetical protein n=1 Tax=Halobacillus sp. BBL2006 TaxID=1543706 RepID=UPI0005420342|nr:hypothetical protein [Halobacillus sp. BBL2006]KHE73170.1 hypothetical protein LD39_00865 [Halobacillus sp. BBL2006]